MACLVKMYSSVMCEGVCPAICEGGWGRWALWFCCGLGAPTSGTGQKFRSLVCCSHRNSRPI